MKHFKEIVRFVVLASLLVTVVLFVALFFGPSELVDIITTSGANKIFVYNMVIGIPTAFFYILFRK